MRLRNFVIPMTLVAALAAGAGTASAQRGGGGGGHMGGGGGGHMGGGHAGGGHMGGPGGGHVGHGGFPGPHNGGVGHHGGFDHNGGFDHHGGFNHHGGPFVGVHVVHPFHGPFFAFRPRFGLGFGLFVGYPVPYPWDYVSPYDYPYDYPYYVDPNGTAYDDPDDVGNSTTPADELRNYGGLSFDITPNDATVTVDGTNVGTVDKYSPSSAPLTLAPGRHHVVIEKQGYQPMTFDSDVTAGQVVPYQGTMQPE